MGKQKALKSFADLADLAGMFAQDDAQPETAPQPEPQPEVAAQPEPQPDVRIDGATRVTEGRHSFTIGWLADGKWYPESVVKNTFGHKGGIIVDAAYTPPTWTAKYAYQIIDEMAGYVVGFETDTTGVKETVFIPAEEVIARDGNIAFTAQSWRWANKYSATFKVEGGYLQRHRLLTNDGMQVDPEHGEKEIGNLYARAEFALDQEFRDRFGWFQNKSTRSRPNWADMDRPFPE